MNKKLIVNVKYELKYNYYITDTGKVWSECTKKYLSPQLDKDGYEKIQMMSTDNKRHRYSVHRLVMENFSPIENMDKMQVNHKDGDKRNNNLANLEWCTSKENIGHAIKAKLRAEINGSAKLTKNQVIEIYKRTKKGETNIELGKIFDVHPDTIGRIRNKRSWKNILDNIN